MTVDWKEFRFPDVDGVRCAFGGRVLRHGDAGIGTPLDEGIAGSISLDTAESRGPVLGARKRIFRALHLSQWVELKQVHGTRMVFGHAPAGEDGTGLETSGTIEADGHGTSRKEGAGRALVIKTADCQPVLIAHKDGDHVAALHVGWRGNASKFIETGIAEFCARYGLAPGDLRAVRGPSLGPERAEFVNFAQEWPEEFLPWFDAEHKTMDLWALTRAQLETAGLWPENILSIDHCTRSNKHYFSHRRGDRGRQASLIWVE